MVIFQQIKLNDMARIIFKRQQNRASKSLQIESAEIATRELMDALYQESQITGINITLLSVEKDDSADEVVKSMTFGIGNAENPRIPNVQADGFWINMIPASSRFICLVVENITTNAAQLTCGTIPSGFDIFENIPIAPKVGDKNGLTLININNVFDLHNPTSIFLHHGGAGDGWNGANLNLIFLFGAI
jgi:hypothetical protein